MEPQGSLARSISERDDPLPLIESPSCRKREIRQLLENSDPLLVAQQRPEGLAGDANAYAATTNTPLESAEPVDVDVEVTVEVSSGFQENEAFVSGVDDMGTEEQRPLPCVTESLMIESQAHGLVDPPRVDDVETRAGGRGDGDENIPYLSSTSQNVPGVSDEGGGNNSNNNNVTARTKIVGSNGRHGSISSSSDGGGEKGFSSDKQEFRLVGSFKGNADAASAPSSIDGADKRGVLLIDQRKTSDVVEDALRLHRGHQMLRRSPLSKEPVVNRSTGGGCEGGDDGGECSRAELLIPGGRIGDTASNDSRVMIGNGVSSDFAEALAPRAYFDTRGEAGLVEKVKREGVQRDEESVAICQARALFGEGLISEEELEAVVSKDKVGRYLHDLGGEGGGILNCCLP